MPTYITLMKMTDQGIKDVKTVPRRLEEGIKAYEAVGGRLIGFYLVTGDYDYVSIGEAPSDEVGMTFALQLASLGNVRTTTLKAFPREELVDMIKKLP